MAHRIELKGKAKTYAGAVFLLLAAWLVFGQSFFTFNVGVFNRGYQTSFLRGGHFEKHGFRWDQHDRTLGRIVSLGNELLHVDIDAEIGRGTLVIYAWRWPAFLHDEPVLRRLRVKDSADRRLAVPLPGPGLYVLSISGINLRGDVTVDWRVGGA